jgi:hypothetical protein
LSIDSAMRKEGSSHRIVREAEGTVEDAKVELSLNLFNNGRVQLSVFVWRDHGKTLSDDYMYPDDMAAGHMEFDAQVKKYGLIEKKKESEGV